MFITLPATAWWDFTNNPFPPQCQELIFTDPNDGNLIQRHTIYTGELFKPGDEPLLNAGSYHFDLTFQFPLYGTFYPKPPPLGPDAGGGGVIGIKPVAMDPLDPKKSMLRSAVAEAAVTSAEWGSNPVWADITGVSADLMSIMLDDGSGKPKNIVALAGKLTARNSQIKRISYRVTVLERQLVRGNDLFLPTLLKATFGWTGTYTSIDNIQREGIPQDEIDWK